MKQPYQPSSYLQELANSAVSWPDWFLLSVLLGSERDQISTVSAQGGNCSVFRLIYVRVAVLAQGCWATVYASETESAIEKKKKCCAKADRVCFAYLFGTNPLFITAFWHSWTHTYALPLIYLICL